MPVYEAVVPITFAGAGQPGANVWHFRTDSFETTINDDVESNLENLKDFYYAIRGVYPTTATLKIAEQVTRIDVDPPVMVAHSVNEVTGSGSGELPERLAILLKIQTAHGGRSGRGRKFLGPVANSNLESNGTVSEPAREMIQAAYNDMVNSSNLFLEGAIGVYSRLNSELYDIVGGSVDNEFAQLSSRRF